jgi:hypothetical protein
LPIAEGRIALKTSKRPVLDVTERFNNVIELEWDSVGGIWSMNWRSISKFFAVLAALELVKMTLFLLAAIISALLGRSGKQEK